MYNSKASYVYILASKRNGTLYIGFTSNLQTRVYEHKEKLVGGFTERYNVTMLVYYEVHKRPSAGIQREKQMKKWNRKWKLRLIEKHNPSWHDLYCDGEIFLLPNVGTTICFERRNDGGDGGHSPVFVASLS